MFCGRGAGAGSAFAAADFLESPAANRVRYVVLTVTNNANGGRPVSVSTVSGARSLCDRYGIPRFFDVSQFVQNLDLNARRDAGYAESPSRQVATTFTSGLYLAGRCGFWGSVRRCSGGGCVPAIKLMQIAFSKDHPFGCIVGIPNGGGWGWR
ncbi:beta-eliminating lyase-related protein [Amycolatopsis alkalitolerans]|uniref:Aromatic amino acid beta-eliminating lyase/threonine aldolase domain-containing protein n=1 Tax=Amycolatopsis alkalitolerans TaxID=2547244 RepID=A0A5C4LTY3_9PSEU|nr:hypothetical protein FG385_25990 [Amycolatopsis alkalitolerans]